MSAVAGVLLPAVLTSALALPSSSMLIRGSAVMSMLSLPLLLALVFAAHVWNDDFTTIRFLASGSGTVRAGCDLIVILLSASRSDAGVVSLTSCGDEANLRLLFLHCQSFSFRFSAVVLPNAPLVTSHRRSRRLAPCVVALTLASFLLRRRLLCACGLLPWLMALHPGTLQWHRGCHCPVR